MGNRGGLKDLNGIKLILIGTKLAKFTSAKFVLANVTFANFYIQQLFTS